MIILALGMILFSVLLFASYFAARATPETPFVQRVAQSVWRLLHQESQQVITSASITTELSDSPPSYSMVDLHVSI